VARQRVEAGDEDVGELVELAMRLPGAGFEP
jgi:hypothetical protein